jgi:hypothetical protein
MTSTPTKTIDELRSELKTAEDAVLKAGKAGDLDELQTAFSARAKVMVALSRLETEERLAGEKAEQERIMKLTSSARDKILKIAEAEFGELVKTTQIRTLYVRHDDESGKWRVDITLPRAKAAKKSANGKGGGGVRLTYNGGMSSRAALTALAEGGNEEAQAAFQRIEDAKAAGKFSPGFDSTLKSLIGKGLITPDPVD